MSKPTRRRLREVRAAEEVRGIDDVGPAELPKADLRLLDIARRIIEQQAGDFDPSEFNDRYEDALRALIEEKRKGMPVRPESAPPPETWSTSWTRCARAWRAERGHRLPLQHRREPKRGSRREHARQRRPGRKGCQHQPDPAASVMSTQLPLPASWAAFESRRDPRDRLTALQRDSAVARAKIREALDELAAKHGIPKRDVTYAMEGYADNLLGDVVYNLERAIEHEIEGETAP